MPLTGIVAQALLIEGSRPKPIGSQNGKRFKRETVRWKFGICLGHVANATQSPKRLAVAPTMISTLASLSWRLAMGAPASVTGWRKRVTETRVGLRHRTQLVSRETAVGLSNRLQLRTPSQSCFRATCTPSVSAAALASCPTQIAF